MQRFEFYWSKVILAKKPDKRIANVRLKVEGMHYLLGSEIDFKSSKR